VDQKPRKRRLGRLSWRQERALDELLARGLSSIRWAAQEVDVPFSTMRRWPEPGNVFRAEYDRRLQARRDLFDAALATARDPKASPWTRMEAINQAREFIVPPRNPQEGP